MPVNLARISAPDSFFELLLRDRTDLAASEAADCESDESYRFFHVYSLVSRRLSFGQHKRSSM